MPYKIPVYLICRRYTALACICLLAAHANANSAASIDEIQVTATRKAANIASVSTGVTVIHDDQIILTGLITDALANQVGTFVQETTPGQGAIIIRGMKGSEVLHLVDSVRLNNAIFRNAPTQYAALVDPWIIERVEVVRGSVASLYGSDAMGGAANFITRKPTLVDEASNLHGDANLFGNSADLAKAFSVGVEASGQSLAGLARVSTFESGNRRTGDAESRTPYTGYRYNAGRLALAGASDEHSSWLVDLQLLQQPKTNRVDELIPGYGLTVPESSEFSFEPNQRDFAHVQYALNQGLWAASWTFDLGWQRILDDRTIRSYESDVRNFERNSSDLFTFNIEALNEAHYGTWIYGVAQQHDTVNSTKTAVNIVSGARTSATSRFPDDSTVSQGAVYARWQQPATYRSNFSIGGRYTTVDIDVPDTASTTAAEIRFTDLTGDMGWIYALTERWSLLSNLSRGFRAPNIFDLGTFGERPGNRFNIPNEDLAEETVTQFDVGLRHSGPSWSGEMRLYALRYKDKIESVDTGAATADGRQITQSQNLSSVDLEGIEFSVDVLVSDNLNLGALLNFTHGEVNSPGEASSPADRIPPLNGRIDIDWHVGEQWLITPYVLFATAQDRLSVRDANDPRINPNGTPGWATLNIKVAYNAQKALGFTFALTNILDENYRVHGSGLDARGFDLSANVHFRW